MNDGTTDSSSNFLSALQSETNVSITITNSNVGLETSSLTGSGLLLNRHDLHDFITKRSSQKMVNNLEFLDWKRVQEDFFNGLNFAILYQTTKLGDWSPFILITFFTSSTATTTATAPSWAGSRPHQEAVREPEHGTSGWHGGHGRSQWGHGWRGWRHWGWW